MNRILSWLALIASVAIFAVALYEISSRSDDNTLALPTAVPSPSTLGSGAPSTSEEPVTEAPVTEAPVTEAPVTETVAPEPTETVAPPPTATPEPPLPTQGPIDRSLGPTAQTGADPVPGGVAISVVALGAFVVERRTRRAQ